MSTASQQAFNRARELAWGMILSWCFTGALLGFFYGASAGPQPLDAKVSPDASLITSFGTFLGLVAGVMVICVLLANVWKASGHPGRAGVVGFLPAVLYLFVILLSRAFSVGSWEYLMPGGVLTFLGCSVWALWCWGRLAWLASWLRVGSGSRGHQLRLSLRDQANTPHLVELTVCIRTETDCQGARLRLSVAALVDGCATVPEHTTLRC
ncbi:MAG: hypothetical protein AMXMBFR23_06340 [Chloroflexota bacterium]